MTIPVIDIFAGPGGLGEGFEGCKTNNGKHPFKVSLSIEKDKYAWQTLLLRSFYRQFPKGEVPDVYYKFVRSKHSDIKHLEESLEDEEPEVKQKFESAKEIAWKATLGKISTQEVDHKIESKIGDKKEWVLVGGPPCQAYSVVGRSRKGGLDPEDHRVYLYREYYRILAIHGPPVFVMENVKGLLSARLDDDYVFEQILNDLRDPVHAYSKLNGKGNAVLNCPGYYLYSFVSTSLEQDENYPYFKNSDFVIRSENYGIPQARHRIILLGIRKDLANRGYKPPILEKVNTSVTAGEVLRGLPELRSGLSKSEDSDENWIQKTTAFNFEKLKGQCDEEVLNELQKNIDQIKSRQLMLDRGGEFLGRKTTIDYEKEWFHDENLRGVCNHTTRGHIHEDLHRYLFVSTFGEVKNRSPKLDDFPECLLPDHKNVQKGKKNYKFADRFRVQLEDETARTITSHISKDGHYYIHYDPLQCRSLTVREAARIQTFPDNYFFCGPRTSQYVQVGNAVPPLLARQIAEIVYEVFTQVFIQK